MLCTKCGQEYEGSQCPRCDGPVILVNNSDYLARRKAYEEKQALKERSAFSAKKETGDRTDKIAKIKAKLASGHKKQGRKFSDNKVESTRKRSRAKLCVFAAVAVLIVAVCAFFIYRLSARKNYALYVSYNDKIYDIAELDSTYVCDENDAVFASDNQTFYTPQWPDDIDRTECILSRASDDGKYFTALTYDAEDTKGTYSLYIWNESECVMAAHDDAQKEILYITDDGEVIYTNMDMINDEWSISGTLLAISSITESKKDGAQAETKTIEGSLARAYVYSDKDLIIYTTEEGMLYSYDYAESDKSVLINDSVSGILMLSNNDDTVYSESADSLNTCSGADTFMYISSGAVYYYSCSDKSSVKLDSKASSNIDYIYDDDKYYVYRAGAGKLSVATVKDGEFGEFEEADSMGKVNNFVYLSSEGKLVYINADNCLRSISGNKITDIAENVSAGSLSKVYNRNKAVTYISGGSQYYMDSVSKDAVLLFSIDSTDTEGTCYYKNRIYASDDDGTLIAGNLKGTDSAVIGEVDRLWLGTELK